MQYKNFGVCAAVQFCEQRTSARTKNVNVDAHQFAIYSMQ
jgi:hypothetical protein